MGTYLRRQNMAADAGFVRLSGLMRLLHCFQSYTVCVPADKAVVGSTKREWVRECWLAVNGSLC